MVELALEAAQRPEIARAADARNEDADYLRVDVLTGASAYLKTASEWKRLAELQKSPSLFQAPALLSVWARHFRGGEPVTLVVREGGEPVLIWPLLVKRNPLMRIATGAGAPFGQYDEILLHPEADPRAAFKAALDALSRAVRPDLIVLERVRADSALAACLADETPLASMEAAPYADLSNGLPALMASLKTRVTRQQRKRMRKVEELGVRFELADEPAKAMAWLGDAIALKREWLRSTGRISRAFASPELASCLADLAATLSAPGASPRVAVSRVTFNGKTAAIEMGLCHRGVYHLYLGAFAPEFAKLGPGNVLTENVMEWCTANGIRRYDMLAPRTRNKREWQSAEVAVHDFALPLTARGRLYEAGVLRGLVPAVRRAFYALPAPLRSRLAGLALNRSGKAAPSEDA